MTTYTAKELKSLPLATLRSIAKTSATEYYTSSKCPISFGNIAPEQAAAMLVSTASKTSLIKDIISIQKKMQAKERTM